MENEVTCNACQNPLPKNSPGGTCPVCLLGLGLPASDARPTAAMAGAFTLPPVEVLNAKFPDLELDYLIGQGGMGAVYRARHSNLDRIVALKVLAPQLGEDPAFAERFLREARTLAKLSHPNIVAVFDVGQIDDLYFLTMEFVEGVNLRDTIEAKTIDPENALSIIPQICDALQYAHDQGVVHRDIKPENILLATDGTIKIVDFGLAKMLDPKAQDFTLTATRQVLGTYKYMAPEQIETPDSVDHRADLYSLGVVFYELLTGELPIGRFALPSEKAAVNQRLDDVVMKTLEKEPDRRFQQASQLKTAVADAGTHVAAVPEASPAMGSVLNSVPIPQLATNTRDKDTVVKPSPQVGSKGPFSLATVIIMLLVFGVGALVGLSWLLTPRHASEVQFAQQSEGVQFDLPPTPGKDSPEMLPNNASDAEPNFDNGTLASPDLEYSLDFSYARIGVLMVIGFIAVSAFIVVIVLIVVLMRSNDSHQTKQS